jgi:O-antigen/teichoic acid export membrane protein
VGVPHNLLISDLILENRPWKALIGEALHAGSLTDILWNPRVFAGVPFLAAGQQSALYPLSAIFYVLPLWRAYGVFTWLQLGLAALGMFVFARMLGQRRAAATLAAVIFTFSGFYVVSVAFTMIIAAAAWLPLILAVIEMVVRKQEEKGDVAYSPVPYIVLGAVFLGLQVLAGHVEITYYTLMVSAFYAAWRLVGLRLRLKRWRPVLRLTGWLAIMVALGLALGAVQLIPLVELVRQSFREGSASLQQVRAWAWPSRQIITFLLPDFFGNPTAHSYFDIWQRVWAPVTQNALGEPLNTIDWGVKNYVEGGNYLGLLTWLLAAVAVLAAGWAKVTGSRFKVAGSRWQVELPAAEGSPSTFQPSTANIWPFVVLAALSLLFAFGTPLYAVLYYLLPGYSQLHSAFRWVFPFTLSMAVLAGFGLDVIVAGTGFKVEGPTGDQTTLNLQPSTFTKVLGWLAVLLGAGALLVVAVSIFAPAPFVALGDKLLAWSDLARTRGFADGAVAWSYEATGLARFGLMALLAGAGLLWVAGRHRIKTDERMTDGVQRRNPFIRAYPSLIVLLLILDLWLFGHGFNSAADPKLLDFKPPVVQWLQDQQDPAQPWRLTSFDAPDEKLLNANSTMPYGLEDVRGYDSIIPKSYATYMARIQPQGDLLYNRIAPIYTTINGQPNYDTLDSRLLDLLGVRYVVTTHAIPNAGYELAYDGEVKVYQNQDALPRAFVVGEAVAAPDQTAALDLLQTIDPAQKVVIEGLAPGELPPVASPQVREARIAHRTNREVFVDVNVSDRGWLVLADGYFDGWKAYLRPFGVEGEGVTASGESIEQQLPLYRADGAFRAVYLPAAGQWTVRFVYSPRSFLLGLYASFLAVVTLLLLLGWWAWGRYYRGERSEVGTVAKNSAVQMGMSLLSRSIDFAFAMLRLRVLSPTGEGSYAFAISFYGIFEIITRYGLGTLVMRDVAVDRTRARKYLTNTVSLRIGLWLATLPIMALVCWFYWAVLGRLDVATARAIALFAAALLFANISDAISAIFNAYEKMEFPAGISTAIAVAKVALGALVLLPPFSWGFVGLAFVSLLMNIVQMIWLYVVLRQKIPFEQASGGAAGPLRGSRGAASRKRRSALNLNLNLNLNLDLDLSLQRYMLRESGPLMLNNLLATVFWRISQWVLYGARNPAALGIFSAGVKYLDGLNIIPAYFTLAIFPLMSRYAAAGKDSLLKGYRLAVQLLYIVALPIAVFVSFAATPLIRILGGPAYLPGGATALSIMIWSIPIGFINSVTQYVLIAVNQQRFLTKAFLIGVVFTAAANLLLVPKYGYIAAAVIQIPAELSLFIPFYWAVRRYVAPMPWRKLLGGPSLAAGVNAAVVWLLERAGVPLILALGAGFLAYVGVLALLGTFRGDDFTPIRARLPKWLGGNRLSSQ